MLKIRRRKFQRTPPRRRDHRHPPAFRTGDSEYLLNGKLCRLRDIQDIFMGTGLGPETYAIIGQERIGQLLSSKPHDRRAIIEEAAGITRFKTKKRLAELVWNRPSRISPASTTSSRKSPGRWARSSGRPRRPSAMPPARRDARSCASCSPASLRRWTREQAEHCRRDRLLTTQIDEAAAQIESLEAEHADRMSRGYELDASAKEASARASQAAVELERATARQRRTRSASRS